MDFSDIPLLGQFFARKDGRNIQPVPFLAALGLTPSDASSVATALTKVAATRALASYGQSDGVTSSRGVIYSNATRQAIAGLPTVQIAFEMLVPTSNPSANAHVFLSQANATSNFTTHSTSVYLIAGSAGLGISAAGAALGTDFRNFNYTAFRTTYSGQRVRVLITLTAGTTNPVVYINGTDVSASFVATTGGTPPNWLDASLSSAFQIAGFNWPAGEIPLITPIIGSLTTAERTEYFATGRLPAWVSVGGSGVGLVTNTGFEVDTTGWATQGAGSIARITSDFNTGVACLEAVAASSGQGVRTDIGSTPTERNHIVRFWAKSVSGNTTLTVGRSNGSSAANYTLTSSWQQFTHSFNSGTLIPSLGTNIAGFWLNGAGTFRIDDVQIWQAGATTLPAYQPLHVVRDLTSIGGNQGRMVGVAPVLLDAQDGSRIEVPSQAFVAATSVNILGGALNANKTQRIISVTGNSSASTTISLGTSSGGTQLVNAQAVNGNFDITTIASRFFASGASIWVTFAGNTTASVTINTSDL